MVRKKAKSKRGTFKDKYKVQRKVKEHKRKMRKAARANGDMPRTRKDPGIPNLWPYKEKLLSRMSDAKERVRELEQKQREARKERLNRKRFEKEEKKETESSQSHMLIKNGNQKKWFMKDLKQVLEVSDVILEVLDARDPQGCRCRKIEEMVQGKYSGTSNRPKRIILVLNKIDLVPQQVVLEWVRHLRREFACVAFKASTQQQRGNLAQSKMSLTDASQQNVQGGKSVGGQALLQLIKNYSRSHDIKTNLTVGVIGFPNVGKSSLINSLKRARAVGVGAQPGFTKQCQLVKLDKQISIIDSPGVLFDADTKDPGLSLRNCLKVEDIEDPVGAVKEIVKRCDKSTLLSLYRIANFSNGDEFLYRVAGKRGKLGKGGVPDMPAAARCVLRDWNMGKIPFYTLVPNSASEYDQVDLLKEFSQEFDLDKVNDENIKTGGRPANKNDKFMTLETHTSENAKSVTAVSSNNSFEGPAPPPETGEIEEKMTLCD
uniref:CP-type G domain-containing protein n=1 Tax=Amorphochlora amoebiformis TaxID=1561963 RepID=A0A7S0CUJ8_9EUKA|mmetsp:Transcript_12888/g.20382  ORF Transcript_12888/g.20382 Transcript_12888/m.20382 type:complete len:488 (+) Transcript_12888:47-1510(+)